MNRSAALPVEPLEVQPRWLLHIVFLLVLLGAVVAMAAVRRGDLDVDDELWAIGLLVLSFWIFALALGSLVRSMRAGYALRLDGRGLHVPGLDVVPWRAIRGADLHQYERSGKRFAQLVVYIDVDRGGAALTHYERYLFGPLAGLYGSRGKIVVPVMLLAIEPEPLLARTREFVAKGGMIETAKRDVAAAASGEQRAEGQRRP